MVPDISTGIPRAPAYSGADSTRYPLRLRGSHPLWPGIPAGSARLSLIFGVGPITPAPALRPRRFGLFPVRSPLLGKSLLLSFPMGTKMFQFPTFASLIPRMTESLPPGCPIRTSAGQWVFAPRRGFSQLVTSFFASESQGIPHAPFSSRCTFQEVCDLLVFSALPLPYRIFPPPVPLGAPGSVSMRRSLCSTLVVCSQCSVTYTASPVCQCTRFWWRITDSNR